MLKEINKIAREMLFLQGHLARPEDFAETPVSPPRPKDRSSGRSRSAWHRFATALVAIPTRAIVLGQIR